jgi:hypothetical protein
LDEELPEEVRKMGKGEGDGKGTGKGQGDGDGNGNGNVEREGLTGAWGLYFDFEF